MLTAKCQIHLLTYSVLIYFVQINLYEIAAVGTLFIMNILPRLILLLLEHYLRSIFCLLNSCCCWNIIYYQYFASSNPAAIGTLFTINI